MTIIRELQHRIGQINTANGWRTHEDRTGQDLVNAQVARLALITTEVAEAIEEIRNGRKVTDRYFTGGAGDHSGGFAEHVEFDANGAPRKPEGVPSELADIIIRALDAADAWGIDMETVIEEKLAYNVTRGFRHGGKTV